MFGPTIDNKKQTVLFNIGIQVVVLIYVNLILIIAISVCNHTNYDVMNKWLVPTNKLVFENLINPPSFLSYWGYAMIC